MVSRPETRNLSVMNIADTVFDGATTILDVGGWFLPEPRATHVVDLMPWETRGATLTLAPKPGEKFSKATWHQADFLKPDFRLPFSDKSFDLVICGHTVEDLSDPRGLLREMARVGKRGVIECPSRITEQTIGVRGRESCSPGHPHHHWIVESVGGQLRLYSKQDSRLTGPATTLPLCSTEALIHRGAAANIVLHHWQETIDCRVIAGNECLQRARDYVASLNVSGMDWARDRAWRFARRLRRRLRRQPSQEDLTWWTTILEASRPYSTLELPSGE